MGQGESTPSFLKSEAEARAWGFTDEQIQQYKIDHGIASSTGGNNAGDADASTAAANAFSHPATADGAPEEKNNGPPEDDAVVIGRKILSEMRMHHMTLTSVFANFDDNNDSTVTLDEMAKGFREAGAGVAGLQLTDMEARAIFERFDADGSGGADVKELRGWFESLEELSLRGRNIITKKDAPKGFYDVPFFNFDSKTAELRERAARWQELDRVRAEARAAKAASETKYG